MNLWAVTMVKDESEIIEHTLRHLVSEGVTGIIVADNMSTDNTSKLVRRLDLACELVLISDRETGYYQSRKITSLAQQAIIRGAEWVLPFDADEIWYSTKGTVHDAIVDAVLAHNPRAIYATLHNYYPVASDDAGEANPFLRITHRDPEPSKLSKVIARRGRFTITQGNHDIEGPAAAARLTSDVIQVAHFPWRGWPQFQRKVENGAAAYKATDLPDHIGTHWRLYGELLEAEGPAALRAMYSECFENPEIVLERWPAPWCRHAQSL